MKLILTVLAILMVIALVAVLAASLARGNVALSVTNNAGTHGGGRITCFAESAFASSHLVAGKGTTAGKQVSPCAATGQVPVGFAVDEAAAGEEVAVEMGYGNSVLGVASKAIAADVPVYTATGGKLTDTGGTGKYLMGRSKTAAGADGDEFEVIPCPPVVQA